MRSVRISLLSTLALAAAGLAAPAEAGTLTTVATFPAGSPAFYPNTGVVALGGLLYGTAPQPDATGSVYSIDPATGTKSLVYAFLGTSNGPKLDGAKPSALTVMNGMLYGTTASGGASSGGTVFAVSPATGQEQVLVSFTEPSTGVSQKPTADALAVSGRFLFGTLQAGGAQQTGAIYRVSATGQYRTLYQFPQAAEGCNPGTGVIAHENVLYGTTTGCGAYGFGTLYAYSLATQAFTTLYSFTSAAGPLHLLYRDGVLYGATATGGANNAGSVYSYTLASGSFTLLHSFSASEIETPASGLTVFKGRLYGIATAGPAQTAAERGGIYAINPTTGDEAVVSLLSGCSSYPYACGPDADPAGDLLAYQGALWGTTTQMNVLGAQSDGSVYNFVP